MLCRSYSFLAWLWLLARSLLKKPLLLKKLLLLLKKWRLLLTPLLLLLTLLRLPLKLLLLLPTLPLRLLTLLHRLKLLSKHFIRASEYGRPSPARVAAFPFVPRPGINMGMTLSPRTTLPFRHRLMLSSMAVATCLSLAGCGREDGDPASGGLTVGESDRLEAAAQRLDAREASPARDDSVALEGEIRDRLSEENVKNSAR